MKRIFQDVSLTICCELTIYLPAMAFCSISRSLQKVILDVPLLGDERPRKFKADNGLPKLTTQSFSTGSSLWLQIHCNHALVPFLKGVCFSVGKSCKRAKTNQHLGTLLPQWHLQDFSISCQWTSITLKEHCLLNSTSAAGWGHSFKTQPCLLTMTKTNLHVLVFCLWEERGGLTTSLKDLCSYRRAHPTETREWGRLCTGSWGPKPTNISQDP